MTMLARGRLSVEVILGNLGKLSLFRSAPSVASLDPPPTSACNKLTLRKKAFVKFDVNFENFPKERDDGEISQAVKVEIMKFNLYIKPQAIEHAFTIYITYKNAFDYFKREREKRFEGVSTMAQTFTSYSTRKISGKTNLKKENNLNVSKEGTTTASGKAGSNASPSVGSRRSSTRIYFLFSIQNLAICVPLETSRYVSLNSVHVFPDLKLPVPSIL